MRTKFLAALGLVSALMVGTTTAQAAVQTFYDNATGKWVSYDIDMVRALGTRAAGSSYSPIPRETVAYAGPYGVDTIVIDTSERRLYYVTEPGKAVKYGIGVGREGFTWTGTDRVSRKAEWPSWSPPAVMIAREKAKGRILPTFMKGGEGNPLGARALYIGDRIYRIHGTAEPWTIGQAVSSGCIRLVNDDVVDLYNRAKVGTRVVVLN